MKFILGRKIENRQLFLAEGKVIPVTVIQAGPCQVVQVKAKEKDGSARAVQIGFGLKNKLNKALAGHLKGLPKYRYLREFKLPADQNVALHQEIGLNSFSIGEHVKISGTSKGKGFQGVVRRHGFHGQKATHGHKDQERMPGSIGSTGPQRVLPGTRMAGRMGGDKVTVSNLEIVKIDEADNLLYVKGAVPGARNGLVLITAPGYLKEFVKAGAVAESETILASTSAAGKEAKEETVETILAEIETAAIKEVKPASSAGEESKQE